MKKTLLFLLVSFSLSFSASTCFGQICNTCDPALTINNGILACYPLNGNTSDASGNNRNGTASGLSFVNDRFNTANYAGSFNGSTSNSDITYTAFQENQFTYSLWVNVSTMPTSGNYYSAISIGNANVDQAILLGNNPAFSHIGFGLSSYNTDLTSVSGLTSTGSLPVPNRWYHLVMTRSNSLVSLYVDGVLISSAAVSGKTPGYSNGGGGFYGFIGRRAGAGPAIQNFNGKIDDVRIYNRALTAIEVASLYNFDLNGFTIDAGLDKNICVGDSIQLTTIGTAATSYSWTPANTITNAAIASPYAKPVTTTKYYVTSTSGSCSATDSVIVTVNNNCCDNCSIQTPLNVGLVACYPFNNNANDATGNGYHGTASNVTYTNDRFGKPLKAGTFNGTNSLFTFPATAMQFNSYTYSVWVKMTVHPASGNGQSLISIGDGIGGDQVILICKDCNTFGGPAIVSGITASSYFANSTPPSVIVINGFSDVSNWHHVVLIRDAVAMNMKLYLDGVFISSQSISSASAYYGSSAGEIGSRVGSVKQYVNGHIDDVRIYNRALSGAEVLSLYNLSDNVPFSVNLGSDKTICLGDSVQLNATTTGVTSYSWNPTTGLSNASVANPYSKPSATTQYLATVVTGGCSATDTIVVNVNTNCCATCTTPDPINNGLLACYPFSGNTTNVVNASLDGTNNGATLGPDRFGNSNRAYSFGSSKSISFPTTGLALNTYTYSTWVKINTLPASGTLATILCIGNNGTLGDQTININNNFSGSTGFIASSYRASGVDGAATGVLPTVGVWYHIAAVRDVSTNKIKLYVNGLKAAESPLGSATAGYSTPIMGFVGARAPSPNSFFNGTIDDVRIYNRALSDAEITQLYTLSNTPVLTPIADKTLCKGDSVQLNASGGTSYNWTPSSGLSSSTIANPYAKPLSTQDYIVTVSTGLCSLKDTVTVNVDSVILSVTNNHNICKGDSVQLNATGSNSYRWNTQTNLSDSTIGNPFVKPSVTTKYYVTGTTGNCSKRDSVTITVTSVNLTAGTNKNICRGDSIQLNATGATSYRWNTQIRLSDSTIANPYVKPLDTTTYYVTGTIGTCTAHDSITVNVNTINLSVGSGGTICKGDSIQLVATGASTFAWSPKTSLSDSSIANPFAKPQTTTTYYVTGKSGVCQSLDSVTLVVPVFNPDAGSNIQICLGDSVLLKATGGSSYKWRYNLTLSDTSIANPYAKPTATTTYYVSITNGICSATDSVTITVGTSINVDAGTNRQICLGDSIRLGATGGSSYKWQYNLTLSDSTVANPFAKPTAKTKYYVTGTLGSCTAMDSVEIDISTITADAGTNQNICAGDSIQLSATGGTSYHWQYNTTLSDSTIANPYAKPTASTQYFVTISNGICTILDSVTVSVAAAVNVDAGANQQICLGDSVQLQASGATGYIWLPVTGLSDVNIADPKASPALTTDYIVKGTTLLCSDFDTVRVTVNPIPTIDIGPDTTKCIRDPYTFNAVVTDADSYLWTPSALLDNSTILTPTTNTTVPQTFTLKVTNSVTGCTNTDSVVLNINNPTAAFTLSDTIASNPPLTISTVNLSTPGSLNYQWLIADSVPAYYNTLSPNHTFLYTGRYAVSLTVTDNHGCFDTITRFVTINSSLGVFIPNVFTPNSDGLNDVFQVRYDIANTKLLTGTIWNRWGGKIYEFSMPNGQWWNGKADGIDAASDVYFYIISIVNQKDETKSYHGTVTLLR